MISDYGNRKFSRGFIIFSGSKTCAENIRKGPSSDIVSEWKKTYFGPHEVWVDPKLNYETSRTAGLGVSVLGLCINPFDGSADNAAISSKLYAALAKSETEFWNYVDQLSGSFVILYRINDRVRILQDCSATKPVYYMKHGEHGTVVSSHAALIGNSFSLRQDPRVNQVFGNTEYKKDPSRYMPGSITPFLGLSALSANTVLHLPNCTVERFFPREPLQQRPVDERLIEEVADIFLNQAQILSATGRPLMVAATAGRDSRLSVAAFAHFENSRLFSFHRKSTGHLSEDVDVSRKLSEATGSPLSIYDLSDYDDPDFMAAFKASNPAGIWPGAALCYVKEFSPDAIHIRSTVSEIGRMFYGKRTSSQVTARALASSFTVTDFGSSDLVVQAMSEFIEQSKFSEDLFFNYSFYDMFYWEHRNSKWQNLLCQEAEMATDVFIPYNNRRLIMLLLSAPEADRKAARLHVEATKKLWPALSGIPYIS